MASNTLPIAVLLATLPVAAAAATPSPLGLPHRPPRLVVDGDAADWRDAGARFAIARPAAPGEPAARAAVRLAWDRSTLWALFEVEDPTFHPPPAGIAGAELFQWDSVELYLDGGGDRTARMGADDFQVLLAPDGRYAVLQGDPLLLELEALDVPKRERPAIALAVAGRRTAGGYRVECAIPFAALGVTPRAGAGLAIDLGLNDWLADHPLARQLRFDLEAVRKLDGRATGPPVEYTNHGLAADPAAELERRLYRPWSLAGTDDFGHPQRWLPIALTGAPSLAERWVETLGPGGTIAGGALTTLALVVGLLGIEEWRHRRRIAALLARLAALEAASAPAQAAAALAGATPPPAAAPAVPPSAPAPPAPLAWLEHAVERPPSAGGGERLELKAVRAIHARLGETLAPGELAGALFVSLRSLQRHLGEALGCSPGELILAVKMREARRLLETGELQVQQVAHRVGYDDPAHFSRRFKAYFGLAPVVAVESARRPDERSSVA